MLKRFRVQGFRTCQDVTLDNLGHVTALIGQNGSGKTNLLRAVELFAHTASFTGDYRMSRAHWVQPATFEADIQLGETNYRYALRFDDPLDFVGQANLWERLEVLSGSTSSPLVVREADNVTIAGTSTPYSLGHVPCLPALLAIRPDADPFKRQYLKPLAAFFKAIAYYPLDERADAQGPDAPNIVLTHSYEEWLSQHQTGTFTDESILFPLLHAYLTFRDNFDEIVQLLGPLGLGLLDRIDVTRHATRQKSDFYSLLFSPGPLLGGAADRAYHFNQLSLGTRRIIRLVVSLVLDDSSVMLIEHPEDGIHRGLVKKLIDLISTYANPKQVILSTHSTTVMNALQPSDIRLVTIEDGSTHVRQLSPSEIALAEGYINEEGTLAEFIESVEG